MASVSEPSETENSRNAHHVHLKSINRETNDMIIYSYPYITVGTLDASEIGCEVS